MVTALVELWGHFAQTQQLNDEQVEKFQTYYGLLQDWNELFNLTAITELEKVLDLHFADSLVLERFIELKTIQMLADVGTGPGFPALPLKIKYPHLKIVLIEVSLKKRQFLEAVIQALQLSDVEICELDWRTFLRKTDYPIDLFCARASLQPEELVRIFQPGSPYKQAQLIYWASEQWQSTAKETSFVQKIEEYLINKRRRKLIFMGLHK
ncbi:MAG: 16S rRNA (guanine(527)-N(7))-methyltransferase RsmG [Candidatus Babeliaceae bacterium]